MSGERLVLYSTKVVVLSQNFCPRVWGLMQNATVHTAFRYSKPYLLVAQTETFLMKNKSMLKKEILR